MFDNPNEELKKLEDQLLAVEAANDDFEALYSDILNEFGPETAPSKQKSISSQKKPSKNPPSAGKTAKSGKKKAHKKKKGIKGLVITLCLEIAGVIGVILWWILRLL